MLYIHLICALNWKLLFVMIHFQFNCSVISFTLVSQLLAKNYDISIQWLFYCFDHKYSAPVLDGNKHYKVGCLCIYFTDLQLRSGDITHLNVNRIEVVWLILQSFHKFSWGSAPVMLKLPLYHFEIPFLYNISKAGKQFILLNIYFDIIYFKWLIHFDVIPIWFDVGSVSSVIYILLTLSFNEPVMVWKNILIIWHCVGKWV